MNFIDAFQHLHINKSHGTESPHKPAMLLAVMDVLESQAEPRNAVEFNEDLRERFRNYFRLVASPHDHPHAHYPFFHLRSEPFCRHKPKDGRSEVLEALSTARKRSQVTENIECAVLDDELFALMLDRARRAELREALVVRYFSDQAHAVRAHIRRESRAAEYQKRLAKMVDDPKGQQDDLDGASMIAEDEEPTSSETDARAVAFRRLVIPAYDYTCAACGLRLITEDSWLAQACHLIPWSVSRDDDPRNGISLCPNHHWAMDRDLIAPGPDLVWHVNAELDKRRDGDRKLLELAAAKILGPVSGSERFGPRKDALEWRVRRLS